MYTLKVNGNYNVLVNDISVYVSPTMSPVINQEQFDSSSNLKKLIANGIIVVNDGVSVVEDKDSDLTPVYQDGSAFVKGEQPTGTPSGIFVANPKGVGKKEVIQQPKEEVIEITEEKVETETVEEVTTEAIEVKVEESSLDTSEVKTIESSDIVEPAQKGRPKKTKN